MKKAADSQDQAKEDLKIFRLEVKNTLLVLVVFLSSFVSAGHIPKEGEDLWFYLFVVPCGISILYILLISYFCLHRIYSPRLWKYLNILLYIILLYLVGLILVYGALNWV